MNEDNGSTVDWITVDIPIPKNRVPAGAPKHLGKTDVRMLTGEQQNGLALMFAGLMEVHEVCDNDGRPVPIHRHSHALRYIIEQVSKKAAETTKKPRSRPKSSK